MYTYENKTEDWSSAPSDQKVNYGQIMNFLRKVAYSTAMTKEDRGQKF